MHEIKFIRQLTINTDSKRSFSFVAQQDISNFCLPLQKELNVMQTIDWRNLPFGYLKTDYNVRTYFREGKWGETEVTDSEQVSMHIAATCLHYGQESFEGLKAFRGKDDKIRIFRWEDNAQRMYETAEYILMQPVPKDIFLRSIVTAIKKNEKFIPPYGTGASLYVRPLLIGTGPQVGVKPAEEFLFMVFVTPVGPYFKTGFNPVDVQIVTDYDRAAPHGTGHVKVGGNYAAGMFSGERAHQEGFTTVLFLDAKEKKYIDECGPANFFGIKGNTYITPDSPSVLPSVTNKSLMTLAHDMGMKVEKRKISIDEISEMDEIGACGTAAVITPIRKLVDRETGKTWHFCKDGKAGPVSTKLYKKLQGIQLGDEPDKFNWNYIVL